MNAAKSCIGNQILPNKFFISFPLPLARIWETSDFWKTEYKYELGFANICLPRNVVPATLFHITYCLDHSNWLPLTQRRSHSPPGSGWYSTSSQYEVWPSIWKFLHWYFLKLFIKEVKNTNWTTILCYCSFWSTKTQYKQMNLSKRANKAYPSSELSDGLFWYWNILYSHRTTSVSYLFLCAFKEMPWHSVDEVLFSQHIVSGWLTEQHTYLHHEELHRHKHVRYGLDIYNMIIIKFWDQMSITVHYLRFLLENWSTHKCNYNFCNYRTGKGCNRRFFHNSHFDQKVWVTVCFHQYFL